MNLGRRTMSNMIYETKGTVDRGEGQPLVQESIVVKKTNSGETPEKASLWSGLLDKFRWHMAHQQPFDDNDNDMASLSDALDHVSSNMNHPKDTVQIILVEIVSAIDLAPPYRGAAGADSYVVMKQTKQNIAPATATTPSRSPPSCKFQEESMVVVHQTKAIRNNLAPIWTVKTHSLCLLHIPSGDIEKGMITFEVYHQDDIRRLMSMGLTSHPLLGRIQLSYKTILQTYCNSDRHEFTLQKGSPSSSNVSSPHSTEKEKDNSFSSDLSTDKRGTLFLRFRHATPEDLEFMEGKGSKYVTAVNKRKRGSSGSGGFHFNPNLVKAVETTHASPKVSYTNFHETPFASQVGPILSDEEKEKVHKYKRFDDEKFCNAADFDFKQASRNTSAMLAMSVQQSRIDRRDFVKRYRVHPYPDPDNRKPTTWLSKQELQETSLLPSRKWTRGGSGEVGRIFVEIIGCNNLPNMDSSLDQKNVTDAFVALVFEDTLVRTEVIFDTLSPRWMPWTNRAFVFPIMHPSSVLFLGVFDYDVGSLNNHDPIGRVSINTINFQNNTSYLLHYPIHDDPHQNDSRGTICVRLRVEIDNERDAALKMFTTPPRFYINAEGEKAFKILRYLCRGKVNMEKSNLRTVKLYANELMAYSDVVYYVIDVLIGVLLWRGRLSFLIKRPPCISIVGTSSYGKKDESATKVTLVNRKKPHWSIKKQNIEKSPASNFEEELSSKKEATEDEATSYISINLWFPIHSIVLFQAATTVVEQPSLLPAFSFFAIGWTMWAINRSISHGPSPWHRCMSINELNSTLLLGRYHYDDPVTIREYEGREEFDRLELLDKAKVKRVKSFFLALKTAAMKFRQESKKGDVEAHALETRDKSWSLLSNHLYYLHLALSMACTYLRMGRNIVTWRSHYSHALTLLSLGMGLFCLMVPYGLVIQWSCRFWVWLLLGPWMKLVDTFYVASFYDCTETLKKDPEIDEVTSEQLLKKVEMKRLTRLARIALEDAIKLKDIREFRFGKFSERVPNFEIDRFSSIPLPQSSACPYLPERELNTGWQCSVVEGQQLFGSMIPSIHPDTIMDDKKNAVDDDNDSKPDSASDSGGLIKLTI